MVIILLGRYSFQKGRIYSSFEVFYDIMKNEKIESDNERKLLTD